MTKARLMSQLITNTGDIKRANLDNALDSADVVAAAPKGMTVYSTLDSLPISSLTTGDQAYVSANNRMYISNGSGWYNVALINLSPTMTLDQSGTIALTAESLTSTVTITAVDSDNANLTYSVESDGNMLATGTTVSQDSSVFTITAANEDSGGVAGAFDLTFKVTDGIGIDTEALSFTLTFINIIDSSAETVLLMKAAGNSATNAAITYQNSSDVSTGFTEAGTPRASTFTPYRSGGYSGRFTADGDYYSLTTTGDLQAIGRTGTACTIEGWIYIVETSGQWHSIYHQGPNGSTAGTNNIGLEIGPSLQVRGAVNGAYTTATGMATTANNAVSVGQWYHLALVLNSQTWTVYVNGVSSATATGSYPSGTTHNTAWIGRSFYASSRRLNCFQRDVRVTNTAVYTSNFTPPTEPLTAVTGTLLLTCQDPYVVDKSSDNYTITANGNAKTEPFGPYDYEPWTSSDGGSVYFDGVDDTIQIDNMALGSGNIAVEFWYRQVVAQSSSYRWIFGSSTYSSSTPFAIYTYGSQIRAYIQGSTWISGNFKTNVWHHVALVRHSGTWTFYIDGVAQGTNSLTHTTASFAATTDWRLGANFSNNYDNNCYIAGLKISNESTYTTDFTPPTAPVSRDGSNTYVLMHNKSDANVYDAAAGDTLKITGNTASSTTKRKFTTSSSVYFDGTGDQIDGTQSIDLDAGDFTIEFWWNHTTTPSAGDAIVSLRIDGSNYDSFLFYGAAGFKWQTYASTNGTSWNLIASYDTILSPNNDQWYHYAITREGATIRIYLDGVYKNLWNVGTTAFMPSKLRVGYYNTQHWAGYVQDLRISKYARYTGATNFTPPTAEFEL